MSVESRPGYNNLVDKWLSGWRGVGVALAILTAAVAFVLIRYVSTYEPPMNSDPQSAVGACRLEAQERLIASVPPRFQMTRVEERDGGVVVTAVVVVNEARSRSVRCEVTRAGGGWHIAGLWFGD